MKTVLYWARWALAIAAILAVLGLVAWMDIAHQGVRP